MVYEAPCCFLVGSPLRKRSLGCWHCVEIEVVSQFSYAHPDVSVVSRRSFEPFVRFLATGWTSFEYLSSYPPASIAPGTSRCVLVVRVCGGKLGSLPSLPWPTEVAIVRSPVACRDVSSRRVVSFLSLLSPSCPPASFAPEGGSCALAPSRGSSCERQ